MAWLLRSATGNASLAAGGVATSPAQSTESTASATGATDGGAGG